MIDTATILAIDDSEGDRLLYKRCLQKSATGSYTVTEAVSGEDGLVRLDQEPFDCVLLDYSLPGRNGVEILKRIRVKHPFVAVVMLTGLGNEKVAVAAMQEGAQNYIAKATINPETLAHVIRVAIQHCKMQSRIADQRGSLEVFAHALAHDLKEPVRTIRTLLDLVNSEVSLDGNAGEHFQSIRSTAERMTALIDTVYTYTRLDGAEPTKHEVCEANDLVEAATGRISQLIRERQAVINCSTLPQISVNREQVTQLFQNLLCNAIQNGTTTTRVDITVEEAADHWLFQVSDNGPGLAKEHIDKLFQPFKRLSHHGMLGSGLGLAAAKKILELHGGKIWCESTLGQGARFMFSVSKIDSPGTGFASVAPPTMADNPNEGHSQRIGTLLMVDDDDMALELAQIMLIDTNRLRCKVLVAQDGEEALARLHENEIDLMLLDINMPKMDGFELLERMRAEALLDRVAVVMCSTSTYQEDISKAKDLGARGYLTKPPDFVKLVQILEQSTKLKIDQKDKDFVLLRAA
jgi:signal transduction histidine kinase/BarA-like signal transduction histidine kinase